ncbi:UNKNOWN [Stylonychia lemnae]|uniref:Uncharacterized protein n=1 Tax=Stylonychia lemnae TaxID=5949 RepID=A0A078A1S2_STYLE|nr:UNKNOWN [Stylonychia lemnae]|eukprot:CDW75413.1 UNKNOWN [Stylonychia lemnae]
MTSTSKNKNAVVTKLVPLFKVEDKNELEAKITLAIKNFKFQRKQRIFQNSCNPINLIQNQESEVGGLTKILHKFNEQQTIHREILEDQPRNEFYAKSFNSNKVQIREIIFVMDVGSSNGILSMTAARAGTNYAYAIKMSKMGGKTVEIFGQNISWHNNIKIQWDCLFYEETFKVKLCKRTSFESF